MELILYHKLSTRSRRALLKTKGRGGKQYCYSPRGDLLERLSRETGMSVDSVVSQLLKERKFLLLESSLDH
jgi:hypothetical protein